MTANSPGESPGTQPGRGRIPADTFANRLLLARRMNGLTIKAAAALITIDGETDVASSWSNWENGRRPRDEAETMRAIAEALDVDLQWLMFGGPLSPDANRARRRMSKRTGEDTLRYQRVTVRPKDRRPAGRPLRGGRTSPQTEQQPTHPGGSETRRPRRLKSLVAA